MPRATYQIYVDWDNNGDFDGENDDITAYVKHVAWAYGRDRASQLTGRSTGGSASLLLKNTNGEFNPSNADSPFFGNILPGRRVKIGATYSGVSFSGIYNLWQGFIELPQPQPRLGGHHEAVLRAIGPLGMIADRDVSVSIQENIGTGAAIEDVLDEIDWGSGDRLLDTGQTTMDTWYTGGKVSALYACQEIEDTESGFLRETRDAKISFEDRHHRWKGNHLVSQATFSDAATASGVYREVIPADPLNEIFNIFQVDVQTYTLDSLQTLWTLNETPVIGPGETLERWANVEISSTVLAVQPWTTPASGIDYLANSQADGLGTNMTANITLAATKFDTAMKLALTNGNATTEAYITLLKARGVPLIANDAIRIRKDNAASRAKYKDRSYPYPPQFIPTGNEAEDWANFNLSVYKDPISMVRVSFRANRNEYLLRKALTLDVSDRITLVSDTATKLNINGDYFIEAVSHSLDEYGSNHRVTYQLSPADVYGGFALFGAGSIFGRVKFGY